MDAPEKVHVEDFYYACKTPPFHPSMWRKCQQILNLPEIPLNDRNKLIWCGRKPENIELHTGGSRIVVNEKEIVQLLTDFADDLGFDFVYFDHKNYPSLDDVMSLFSKARIVAGPHGGALFNVNFSLEGTTVVEIMPKPAYQQVSGRFAIWINSVALRHDYWRYHAEGRNDGSIFVDVVEFSNLLYALEIRKGL
eukprot:TRINITY_DN2221_c0_g3_i1.p1 TRINITY_DN2221_c0_g3~~TRINITY_DN2221_c0_g3_i1.p1  ORF type:complete len:216 (+),score=18.46 TRINITY_DN2221_c0_g3_i1:68-649(+)